MCARFFSTDPGRSISILGYSGPLCTVHLDIRPDTICICDGEPIINDMRIARPMNPSDDENPAIPGAATVAYAPPEIFRQSSDSDISDDSVLSDNSANEMSTTISFNLKLPQFQYKEQFDVYRVSTGI